MKGIAEVFGVVDVGHVAADVAHVLCQCRTAQSELVHREVDVVEDGAAVHAGPDDGTHHAADVAHLAAAAHDDRTGRHYLRAVGIFLGHGERVFACGHVDTQCAAEIRQGFDGAIEAGVFALLCAAGPHPVGGQAYAVQALGQGRPHQVGQAFGHGQLRPGGRVGQSGLRCMAQRGGDTGAAAVVQGHDATVGQRQLQRALCLLVCHLSGDGAVHLIGQPVLAGHGFQAEHALHIVGDAIVVVGEIGIGAADGLVDHDRFGRVAEHLRYVQVEGALSVGLLEGEVRVAGRFAHHVHRGAFALGDAAHVFQVFLLDEQSHAFLAFVGNDFLGRECRIAHRKSAHVDQAAAFLDQFREAVHVACAAVVMDADHGVDILLAEGAYQVIGALLHFRVSTLYGIQLDTAGVASCLDGRDGAAAQSDAIVVAADDHDFVSLARFALQAVAPCAVAYTAGQHDDLVIGILLAVFGMFECQYGTGDEGLAKLVAEVAGAVGCLDEDLLRCLVEPFAGRHSARCRAVGIVVAVGGHVDGRTGDGP